MEDPLAYIAEPCSAFKKMSKDWDMIADLSCGTTAMREAGEKWLPRETDETLESYNTRLNRTFLFEGFSDAIDTMASKPFTREVSLRDADKWQEELAWNLDGAASSIDVQGKRVFADAIKFGLSHLLTDYPPTKNVKNLKEEKLAGGKPLITHVPAQTLKWWSIDGVRLTRIRIHEEYGTDCIPQVREIGEHDWKLYRKDKIVDEEKHWRLVDEGINSIGKVPLSTIFIKQTGFLTAEPPLSKLAHLNVEHWQSSSEQRNALRFGRFGMLMVSGFKREEIKSGFVVGPGVMIGSENPEAKAKIIEPNGGALAAGRQDLLSIEKRMEVLGMRPFVDRTSKSTATGKELDKESSISLIASWVINLARCYHKAFDYAAEYKNVKIKDNFSIDIFQDFDTMSVADIQVLDKLYDKKLIDKNALLREYKRRGILASDTN